MPDYTDANQSPLSDLDDGERFVVRNRSEIRLQLITLARKPDILSAYFNHGKEFLLSAVLRVIEERNLLVLDYGPDDAVTKKAIASGQLVCTAKHEGVPIRFSCENLKSARFKGLPAIATPIPDGLFRMQRREFFRVQTPKINGPRCEIPSSTGGMPHQLTLIDLSAGGAGMFDISGRLEAEVPQRFENCNLFLPGHDEIKIGLTVRNIGEITQKNGEPITRYGFSFEEMSAAINTELQRYIYLLQTQQPKQ